MRQRQRGAWAAEGFDGRVNMSLSRTAMRVIGFMTEQPHGTIWTASDVAASTGLTESEAAGALCDAVLDGVVERRLVGERRPAVYVLLADWRERFAHLFVRGGMQ
jgi:hypothetical protein